MRLRSSYLRHQEQDVKRWVCLLEAVGVGPISVLASLEMERQGGPKALVDKPGYDPARKERRTLADLWRDFSDRAFVYREILIRSNDRVRYIRLYPWFQKSVAAAALVGLSWVTYSSVSFVFHEQVVAGKVEEIDVAKRAYFDLLAEVSEYHAQFSQITQDLEENQSYLLELIETENTEGQGLGGLAGRLNDPSDARARVVLARESLRTKLESFEDELRDIAGRNAELQEQVSTMHQSLQASEAERAMVDQARQRLGQRLRDTERHLLGIQEDNEDLNQTVASLENELEEALDQVEELSDLRDELRDSIASLNIELAGAREHEDKLDGQIASLDGQLGQALGRGESLTRERDLLQLQLAGLQQRMSDMREVHQGIVDRLRERTDLTVGAIEQTISITGLDVDALLREAGLQSNGQGGPFVPENGLLGSENSADILLTSVAQLDNQMSRWEALQDLMGAMPLIAPLEEYSISSTFGSRRDPVSGRRAMHYGLDLSAAMRTPIQATAPGVISFAGWRGNYGRMVEIDHGFGIKTRFAHMKEIQVEEGDVVAYRDIIGLVGSSGRSTGPHVHYEVLYDGDAQDPMKFMEAGRFVFKEQVAQDSTDDADGGDS